MHSFSLRRWLRSMFGKVQPGQRRPIGRRHVVELLEDRLAPATFQWSGLGNTDQWSNAANWVGNSAPSGTGNDDLVFPAGAAKLANTNNITAGIFRTITISGGGYTLKGNELTLGNSTAA